MSAPVHVQRVLLLVGTVGELLKRAQARDQEKSASDSKVAELSKKASAALAQHDRILPDQVEKVAAALLSHEAALDLLIELAKHRTHQELGRPAGGEKAASEQPTNRSTVVGAPVANFDATEAGRRFRSSMLG